MLLKNSVKVQAVKEAFSSYYETFQLESLDMKAYSSVLLQPLTPEKTLESAVFTNNRIRRKDVFKQAVIFALIPFTSDKYKSFENSNNND